MAEPIVVVGGSVAAAVAVERLAARGEHVRWLHAGAPIGAGFRGAEVNGRRVNLGPRLLELAYVEGEDAAAPAWSTYRAGHDGHRPWQPLVARYLLELLDGAIVEVPAPELLWRGVRGPDIYFTGDLRALQRFVDADTLAAVAAETEALLACAGAGGVHHDGSDLAQLDLTTASLANHGATFHRLFVDVLARRLRRTGSDGVSAALRNKLWLPLYWPRTLWEAAAGRPIGFLPNRRFQVDGRGGMSLLMERLEARLAAARRVQVEHVGRLTRVERHGAALALGFADGPELDAERVVLGAGPEELFAAAGLAYAPSRLELRLIWIDVATDALACAPPSAWTLADDESALYRIAAAGDDAAPGRALFTVELAHGHGEPDAAALARELQRAGFLRSAVVPTEIGRRSLRAFTDPTIDNQRDFDRALTAFRERAGDVEVVGPAAGFGADPLNEQLLQGIRIAEVL